MDWDQPSQSRRITEGAKPATVGSVLKLRERVDELEKWLAALEQDRHTHCSGCGGESFEATYMHDADCPRS